MLPFLRNRGSLLRWLLLALAETAVVVPWMMLLYTAEAGDHWADGLPGTWLLILTFLAAGLWEAGDRTDQPRRRVYALLAGTALAYLLAYQSLSPEMQTGYLSWNRAVYFLPVAAYLWYQGARGAIEGIEYGRIFSRFSTQFGVQLGGIMLLMMVGEGRNPQVLILLYWSVFLLFGAGLSLLLVTRERALKADQAELGEKGTGNTTTPAMTGVVVGLMGFTLLASRFLAVDRLQSAFKTLGDWISPLTDWLFDVVMLIVIRWLMLIPFQQFLTLMRRQESEQEFKMSDKPPPDFGELPVSGPGANLEPYLKAAMLILALVLLTLWLYRLNRQRRTQREDDEERVNLGFWRSLWADLKALLGLVQRNAAPVVEALTAMAEGENPRDPRALFRRLQAWGSMKGRPRQISETPNRYGQALSGLYPQAKEPSDAVSAVYNRARYGATPPEEESVSAAREALERLTNGAS